jgi:hypothetical protein
VDFLNRLKKTAPMKIIKLLSDSLLVSSLTALPVKRELAGEKPELFKQRGYNLPGFDT